MIALQELIAETLKLPPARVSDEMAMRGTPEWDSLKHMELVIAIEQAYGLEFTGDEIAELTSVAAIRAALARYGR